MSCLLPKEPLQSFRRLHALVMRERIGERSVGREGSNENWTPRYLSVVGFGRWGFIIWTGVG